MMWKLPETKTIKELYTSGDLGVNNGPFSSMPSDSIFSNYDTLELDIDFLSQFGEKSGTPLFEWFDMKTVEGRKGLSKLLYQKFKEQWEHKYNDTMKDYDPLNEFKYHEETVNSGIDETKKGGNTTTDDSLTIDYNTETKNVIDKTDTTNTNNTVESKRTQGTVETINNGNRTTENSEYAYDSNSYSPVDKSVETYNPTTTITPNGDKDTETETGNESLSKTGTETDTKSGTDTHTKHNVVEDERIETLTHGHKIVVDRNGYNNSAVDMLVKDLRFWEYNFINDVFKDIKKELCLEVYK